ncbi:MAG TPA: S-layer homology domain-containing protein, partial [Symbiobacteriaceae bacterium]|nr:S-layer homology domain-containing protein [Symbiobacteriaceae bacterium]
PITRAEVATIAARFKKLDPVAGSAAFPDVAGHWAADWIKATFGAGIVTGYPDGTFKPQQAISRAEFVTIINRLLGRGPLLGRPTVRWPDVPAIHWAYGQVEEASVPHEYEAQTKGEKWIRDRE